MPPAFAKEIAYCIGTGENYGINCAPVYLLCIEGNSANSVRLVKRIRSEVRFSSVRLETLALPTITETAPLVAVSYEGTR